jgi:cytochrome c peroxidase
MRLRHSFVWITGLLAGAGCVSSGSGTPPGPEAEPSSEAGGLSAPGVQPSAEPTLDDRAAACASDPRVVAGVVSNATCVGADLFFRDSFGGNGRTCATCHRVDNNLTIDPVFIANLPPTDPLFIAENDSDLKDLEKPPQMHRFGLILENVDGFLPDPRTHFVLRSVPHTLSLATSVTPGVGEPTPPVDRTGWSGDGAPGQGALRDFMTGAIRQHYTLSLDRVEGRDFKLASDAELDRIDHFMRTTGRTNELALASVKMTGDRRAENGRTLFLTVGCNACHNNAGANTGTGNVNFNTGVESSRNPALVSFPIDGGFGTHKNKGDGSFGDRTFNVPPLIEAADTGPFFHTATSVTGSTDHVHDTATATTIEEAVAFYTTSAFSTAAGFTITLSAKEIDDVGRFLRGINAAFNAAQAIKRIDAELAIIAKFHDTQLRIQREMIRLANVEVNDAINVLSAVAPDLDASSIASFKQASMLLDTARAATTEADRLAAVQAARPLVKSGSTALGTHLDYTIGEGTVMF